MGAVDEIARLKADLAAMTARAMAAEADASEAKADAAEAKANLTSVEVAIDALKLEIARLRRDAFGQRSERGARLINQLELALEDLETDRAEDEMAADKAAALALAMTGRTAAPRRLRKPPVKKPFPTHLPRERRLIPSPSACPCCGSGHLSKLGEDVTETLEAIPRSFKVIQTVREKFSCRACETITQPPAPFHAIARGHVGPVFLASLLYDKFALHQPLHRQGQEFARQGLDLSVSTLADHVGSAALALAPLVGLIEAHVFAAERIHGDDTTIPLLAKKKTVVARLWTYVRDDQPFGGPTTPGTGPPAAIYYFSRDREGKNPQAHLANYHGILQADAYAGFKALYNKDRPGGPILEAACWAHGRRKFFVLADLAAKARDPRVVISPIALEAVKKIDAILEIERAINGLAPQARLEIRQAQIKPLVDQLHSWMSEQRTRVSGKAPIGKALNYMLRRWPAFARFLEDGRICTTNNAAERALRSPAIGRKSWLFAGSERGGSRTAMVYSLVMTCKLNNVDPLLWLADVLARIAEYPARRLHELLPWNWKAQAQVSQAA